MNGSPAIAAREGRSRTEVREPAFFPGWFVFLREAITNPRNVGALFPSSRTLARRMARHAQIDARGPVVELGAGTGVVTAALLEHGIPPSRLFAVERSPALAEILRERFPGIQVVCGDACELRPLLEAHASARLPGPVQIVSSLPLRSLPEPVVAAIVREIAALVGTDGAWIQYTYALAHRRIPPGFHRRQSSVVWRNVPPARVDVFTVTRDA